METLTLRLWHDDDLPLLHRANTAQMTAHLNDPESDQQITDRHARYLRYVETGEARMFAIRSWAEAVGSIGYWDTRWRGREALETGWFVLPEAQGHRVAARALRLLIDDARIHAHPDRRTMLAFPGVENGASNTVCERAGFQLVGSTSMEFRDRTLVVNQWMLDLDGALT